MLDKPSVATAGEPPADGTREQREGVFQNLASRFAHADFHEEEALQGAELQFHCAHSRKSGKDIGDKHALDAHAQPHHKHKAEQPDKESREYAHSDKRLVVAQSAEHLRHHLLNRHGHEQRQHIPKVAHLEKRGDAQCDDG